MDGDSGATLPDVRRTNGKFGLSKGPRPPASEKRRRLGKQVAEERPERPGERIRSHDCMVPPVGNPSMSWTKK